MALPYPDIDPVIISIGPLAIRWYAMAYLSGLLLGWWYIKKLIQHPPKAAKDIDVDDFLTWAVVGVILGGRLGYVLFYKPAFYFDNPGDILAVWKGGMSFHGGLLGVILAAIIFTRKRNIPTLAFGDLLACAAPIGLFFGRIANFINGELFGRVAPDAAFAMVFPHGGPEPRHPSQLYEAGLEGLVLFLVVGALWRVEAIRLRPGSLIGVFLIGYGLARMTVEFFRQPDAHLGYLYGDFVTMGHILSLPMLVIGLGFILYARRKAA